MRQTPGWGKSSLRFKTTVLKISDAAVLFTEVTSHKVVERYSIHYVKMQRKTSNEVGPGLARLTARLTIGRKEVVISMEGPLPFRDSRLFALGSLSAPSGVLTARQSVLGTKTAVRALLVTRGSRAHVDLGHTWISLQHT